MPAERSDHNQTRSVNEIRSTVPAAILWDMDGTIIDSEPYWIGAERRLVVEFGGSWTDEQGMQLIGNPLELSAGILQDQGGVPLTKSEIVDRLIAEVVAACRRKIPWKPGALELLSEVKTAGIPSALVTMSYAAFAEVILESVPEETFKTVVTGDEVEQGKPHPEPYLLAAQRLGVEITECIGIEDSPVGLASVEASGARLIGVQHLISVPAAPGRSRVTTLEDLDVAALKRIAGGEVLDRVG